MADHGPEGAVRVPCVGDEGDRAATALERAGERFAFAVEPDAATGLERLTTEWFDCVVVAVEAHGGTIAAVEGREGGARFEVTGIRVR